MSRKLSFSLLAVITVILGALATLGLLATRYPGHVASASGAPAPAASSETGLARAINRFGLTLLPRLADGNNLFYSPYSIHTALAVTALGARGKTAVELTQVLDLAADRQAASLPLARAIARDAQVQGGSWNEGNAAWVGRGVSLLPTFMSQLRKLYQAQVRSVSFAHRPAAAQEINRWVSERTARRIQKLVDPGDLSESTRLVLTNAVYFKGLWKQAFPKRATSPRPFQVSATQSIEVPTMGQEDRFRYYGDKDLQLLELPYRGDRLAMVVALPARASSLAALRRQLDPAQLDRWLGRLRLQTVDVELPRFGMKWHRELRAVLQALGIRQAFEPRTADLSGLTGAPRLFVDKVLHVANVNVDEQGTVAAAATAVISNEMSARPQVPEFHADRPFLFLIRHVASGAVLFVGEVHRPG